MIPSVTRAVNDGGAQEPRPAAPPSIQSSPGRGSWGQRLQFSEFDDDDDPLQRVWPSHQRSRGGVCRLWRTDCQIQQGLFFQCRTGALRRPPLSRRQMNWRVTLAVLTLVLGVLAVGHVDHAHGDRVKITLATILLIGGLCWTIAAVLQRVMAGKH